MSGYGDKPYGLNDVKITNLAGSTQVDLPVAQTLKIGERIGSGELMGDDGLAAVAGITEAIEWELEAGGISLEAYALLTGRTATETGSSPNLVNTVTLESGDNMPYVKIYGKSLGDGDDDIHVLLFKCKVMALEGTLAGKTFYITKCNGIAVDDGTNGIADFVQHETAAALPGT